MSFLGCLNRAWVVLWCVCRSCHADLDGAYSFLPCKMLGFFVLGGALASWLGL